ncbi:MAG: hypothetical protein HOH43_26325 [Candidatus Latescibacteria bacterium]|jgi:hypothetical protein|nr:hypothetical protein [Candidatus Latescibacterota bacterium]
MLYVYAAVLMLALPALAYGQSSNDTCVMCHATLDDELIVDVVSDWRSSVHADAGIRCVECHGGTVGTVLKEAAHDEASGYIGIPEPETYHEVCGTCHQIQMTNYLASPHGLEGGLWPSCIDCHTSHTIRRAAVEEIAVQERCEDCHEVEVTERFVAEVDGILDPIERSRDAISVLRTTGVPVTQVMEEIMAIDASYSERLSHTFLFDTITPGADSLRMALEGVERDIRGVGEEVDTRRRFGWLLVIFFVLMAGLVGLYRRMLPK